MKLRVAVSGLLLLSCLALSGCSGLSLNREDDVLFRINETGCSYASAKVFLINYRNMYGRIYGIDILDRKMNDGDVFSYIKDMALNDLARMVSMSLLAEEQGIELSEAEEKAVEKAAEEYYESMSEEEREYTGADEKELVRLYRTYALAEKLYSTLISTVDYEVSEDEARVMDVQEILVSGKKKAREISSRLAQGEDFAMVAAQYTEGPAVQLYLSRGSLPKEAEEAAFALSDEEIAGPVETDQGWYFFKCMQKNVQELTEANKEVIASRREQEAIDNVYESYRGGLDSTLYPDEWEGLSAVDIGPFTSDTFFAVYDGE